MYIYKTTNLINSKFYIGKSSKEFNEQYLGSGVILKKAISKYGKDKFKLEILEECKSLEELNAAEQKWISRNLSNELCYNIALGGDGGDTISNHPNRDSIIKSRNAKVSKSLMGHKHSDETIKKISESHSGWFDRMTNNEKEQYRKKMSKLAKEKNFGGDTWSSLTQEEKEIKSKKLSEAAKRNSFGGDTWSSLTQEEKEIKSKKLSEANKNRKVSEETKKKISDALKGRKVSEETKKKISQTLKKKKIDE